MSSTQLPKYLQDQVDKIAKSKGFVNYEIKIEMGSQHGDGFVATMLNIKLTGNRSIEGQVKNDMVSLMCKVLPESEAHRALFGSEKLFDREVYSYNAIIPALRKFQLEKGITEANGFFNTTNCYFAVSDTAREEHAIIMDDLRPQGYSLWNKLKAIDFDRVRVLMIALGRLHGLSFALRDQQPKVFEQITAPLDDVMLDMLASGNFFAGILNSGFDQAITRFASRKEEKYLRVIRETWEPDFPELLGKNAAGRFTIIGHGDTWNNNMMFQGTQNVRLLDWQVCRIGSPALDIVYYLMSSTTKKLRDQHLDQLLQIYYTSLAEIVRKCGSDPEKLFTFNDLQDELRKFGKYGIIMGPVLLNIIVSESKNIPEMDKYAKNFEQAESKDFVEFDDQSDVLYEQRLSDIINDAVEYGWLKA